MNNSVVRFQGQYLARQVRSTSPSGNVTEVHLDVIEKIATPSDADFSPPANSVLDTQPVKLDPSVTAEYWIARNFPQYPSLAKNHRVEGTVVLDAVIRKDGSIGDLKVISGPLMLQQAALDCVKTWRYRPYLLDGEPVEVNTQMDVVFNLFHEQ
jgi:TonB family protein